MRLIDHELIATLARSANNEKISATQPATFFAPIQTHDVPSSAPIVSDLPDLNLILSRMTGAFNSSGASPFGGTSKTSLLEPITIDREASFLLRTYEEGIGVWMDVFDSSSSYRQDLLALIPSSPLLFHSTCALAAQHLSLVSSAQTWAPLAEKHYGKSLSLLRSFLDDLSMDPEHAIVASILLSSYELLKSPVQDSYHQHFRGAKSLVEALGAYKSPKKLTMASFWIYARHELGQSLNLECPPMIDPTLWPKTDFPEDKSWDPDSQCNDMLRISCEVMHLIFGSNNKPKSKKWAKEWSNLHSDLDEWMTNTPTILTGIEYVDDESRRFWFPRPAFAGATGFYHVSKMFLALYPPAPKFITVERSRNFEDQIQQHARQILDIALSDLPDGVLVMMVQPMFSAARHIRDPEQRGKIVLRLEQVRIKTGFHTESKVQSLRSQ